MKVADFMHSAIACDKLATATAQLTRIQTSWFSTLHKINYLHVEITTIALPDFHLSNTDKNKDTSVIIRKSNMRMNLIII
jgi:hypothetical protein